MALAAALVGSLLLLWGREWEKWGREWGKEWFRERGRWWVQKWGREWVQKWGRAMAAGLRPQQRTTPGPQ